MTDSEKGRIQGRGGEQNENAAAIVNARQRQQKKKQKRERKRNRMSLPRLPRLPRLSRMLKGLGLAFDGMEFLETSQLDMKFRDSLCFRLVHCKSHITEKRLNLLMYRIQVHREALRNEPVGHYDDKGSSSIGPGPIRYENWESLCEVVYPEIYWLYVKKFVTPKDLVGFVQALLTARVRYNRENPRDPRSPRSPSRNVEIENSEKRYTFTERLDETIDFLRAKGTLWMDMGPPRDSPAGSGVDEQEDSLDSDSMDIVGMSEEDGQVNEDLEEARLRIAQETFEGMQMGDKTAEQARVRALNVEMEDMQIDD